MEVSGSRCQLLGRPAATSTIVYRCRLLSKAPQPPGVLPWELHFGVYVFGFFIGGGDEPAALLRSLLLLAGDVHPNPGPSWPCPACSRSAARGSVLCTSCNQWWHLTCAGVRYKANLARGWTWPTCQRCLTHVIPSSTASLPATGSPRSLTAAATSHPIGSSVGSTTGNLPQNVNPSLKILQFNVAGLRSRETVRLSYSSFFKTKRLMWPASKRQT